MALMVSCPTCKKKVEYGENNPHRPFCCERCKLIDLGDWADERFRIPVKQETPDLDDESEDPSDY